MHEKKNNPTRTERAAEPKCCCVMGLCEEVDSHRGANHAQDMVEEGSGGVHGLFGVGGGAGPAGGRGGGGNGGGGGHLSWILIASLSLSWHLI